MQNNKMKYKNNVDNKKIYIFNVTQLKTKQSFVNTKAPQNEL